MKKRSTPTEDSGSDKNVDVLTQTRAYKILNVMVKFVRNLIFKSIIIFVHY